MNIPLFLKKTYWKFLLNSCNKHGVHSPFVYELITKCFYKASKKKGLLLRLINYLDLKSVHYYSNKIPKENNAFKKLTCIDAPSKAALIIMASETQNFNNYQKIASKLSDQCLILLENPYKNPVLIEYIEKQNTSKVIVDIYDYAFIFRRDGQVAQNFKIRFF